MSNEVEREAYHKWKSGAEPYGFNGFTAFQAGAEWQRTQSQSSGALVDALEQIARMTYDAWTNGAVASRIAEEALATYRAAQEKPHD